MQTENEPDVLTYDRHKGTATFHIARAAAIQERDFRAAMLDLERLGMTQAMDPDTATPRDQVRPYANVPYGIPDLQGVGDIHSQVTSPGERYWEQWRQGRAPKMPSPVIQAPQRCPLPPEAEPYRAVIEQCFGPQIQRAIQNAMACGRVFNQPMTWLAPPITAISVDVFTSASGVTLTGSYPGPGACIDVLTVDVPDRWIFVLDRFGNELEDHSAFGDVRFSMQRNETPIRSYGNFDVQLGRFDNPTKFGSPIILKSKEQYRLKAQALGAVDHIAYARLIGWAFAARMTSGDGSHVEYCV
jgi:hypothetical protein